MAQKTGDSPSPKHVLIHLSFLVRFLTLPYKFDTRTTGLEIFEKQHCALIIVASPTVTAHVPWGEDTLRNSCKHWSPGVSGVTTGSSFRDDHCLSYHCLYRYVTLMKGFRLNPKHPRHCTSGMTPATLPTHQFQHVLPQHPAYSYECLVAQIVFANRRTGQVMVSTRTCSSRIWHQNTFFQKMYTNVGMGLNVLGFDSSLH